MKTELFKKLQRAQKIFLVSSKAVFTHQGLWVLTFTTRFSLLGRNNKNNNKPGDYVKKNNNNDDHPKITTSGKRSVKCCVYLQG